MAMGYDEGQQMLQGVTGAPPGGPEFPGFWSNSNSPENIAYKNFQEMQTQLQRANLMKQLDDKFHPLSVGDASRYTGIPMDQLANPNQMGPTGTDISYEPTIEEGPRPMGTKPGFGAEISRRHIREYETNPDELFPPEDPNAPQIPYTRKGMWQDFADKKDPYYSDGDLVTSHETRDIPVELQGPGAPREGMRMVESPTGYGPKADAPADWVQRGLTEAAIHRNSLRPNAGHMSETDRKLAYAEDYLADPDKNKAKGYVSGVINQDRQRAGTDSQVDLNKSRAANFEEQTRASQQLLGVRKENLAERSKMLRQQVHELKDTEGIRKEKLGEQVGLIKVMQDYYDARLEGKSAEIALKEANFTKGMNAEHLKELKAQLAYLHEVKPDASPEDVDNLIRGLGERFGIKNIEKQKSVLERIGSLFSDEPPKPDASVGDIPMPQAPGVGERGSTRSMRGRASQQGQVPSSEMGQAPDAAALLKEVEKSLGDVSKLEGKTIRDKKSGKKFRIQNGKPVAAE